MKSKTTRLACLTMLALTALNARAIILFQDNFPYTDGTYLDGTGVWVLPGYTPAANQLYISGNAVVWPGTLTGDTPRAFFTNGLPAYTLAAVSNFNQTVYYFPSNAPVAAIYGSCTFSMPTAPGHGQYFFGLADSNFTFRARIYVITNGVTAGKYRISVSNSGTVPSASTNVVQTDIAPGTTNTLVIRYVLASGISTVWLNPTAETNSATSVAVNAATTSTGGGASGNSVNSVILRNAQNLPGLTVGNVIIATTFAEVYPSSSGMNSPFIADQPKDAPSHAVGDNVTFSVVAGGDPNLYYQWYYNTNTFTNVITFGTGPTLSLTNIQATNAGSYSVVITNGSGIVTSRLAALTFLVAPPIITNQPVNQTNVLLSTANFTVTAGGSQPLDYYWKSVSGGVTNPVATYLNGGNRNTLSLTGVTSNNTYFVTISNRFGITNSALATLTVIPPLLTNISSLRATVTAPNYNPTNTTSLFKVRGIVTTWANMTTSGNSEFFIQDANAAIAVFWGGAPGATYLPPAGTLVEVVAPLSSFNGLEELAPVFGNAYHSVTNVSYGNPLPTPLPLPFDPSMQNNTATMEALEAMYFVATNVMLEMDTGTNFASISAGEFITNASGQTFNMFINSHTDVPNHPKYTCPVDIYGVLGQFAPPNDTTSPHTNGYQFTPSRYVDIVPSVRFTNVLSNLNRRGDLPTNTFSDIVLRPGERITMNLRATDPRSGSLTSIGPFSGLPAAATKSTSLVGGVGTASFDYQATTNDAGTNFAVTLVVIAPSWSSTNVWNIYVPTPVEQKVFISEFLAFASGDSNSPAFNPLQRQVDTGSFGNDRYIEIANLSGSNVDLLNWSIGDASSTPWHTFYNGEFGFPPEILNATNCYVIYGGPLNDTNSPTILGGQIEPANPGPLNFNTAFGGVITLHNGDGHLIDRIAYSPSDLVSNNCSNTRFLYPDGVLDVVPQSYVSTNWVTPGFQYDGSAWGQTARLPVNVGSITVVPGNPLLLNFTADPATASTLWQLNNIGEKPRIIYGQQFTNTSGQFQISNPPAGHQFYGVTKQ